MTHASGTDWALGIEARSRARLSDGDPPSASISRRSSFPSHPYSRRARWRPSPSWRMAAPRALAVGCPRAAAGCPRDVSGDRCRRPSQIAPHLSCWHRGARPQTHRGNSGRPDPAGGSNRAAGPRGASQTRDRRGLFISPYTVEYHLHKVFVVRAGSAVRWGSLRPCGTSVAVPWSGRRPRFGGLAWARLRSLGERHWVRGRDRRLEARRKRREEPGSADNHVEDERGGAV